MLDVNLLNRMCARPSSNFCFVSRVSSPGGRCHGWSGERLGLLRTFGRARAALERFASRDTSDSEKNPFSLFAPVPDLRAKCGVE